MITSFFEQGRFALALRVARSLLGGATRLEQPREPYVQGVTASSAVICWVSQHPGSGVVEYGNNPELGRKEAEVRIGGRHAVALDSELYHGDKGSDPEEQKDFLERDLATSQSATGDLAVEVSPVGIGASIGPGDERGSCGYCM